MEVWETLEFGARAMSLRAVPAKSLDEILEIQRERLQELVRHARAQSDFFREKFGRIGESSFAVDRFADIDESGIDGELRPGGDS